MNGRIYDPTLGRFLNADPIVQSPENSQSHNRYSYVQNSPLSAIDPTGFTGCPLNDTGEGCVPPSVQIPGSTEPEIVFGGSGGGGGQGNYSPATIDIANNRTEGLLLQDSVRGDRGQDERAHSHSVRRQLGTSLVPFPTLDSHGRPVVRLGALKIVEFDIESLGLYRLPLSLDITFLKSLVSDLYGDTPLGRAIDEVFSLEVGVARQEIHEVWHYREYVEGVIYDPYNVGGILAGPFAVLPNTRQTGIPFRKPSDARYQLVVKACLIGACLTSYD